jgi:hypothetical protein
VGDVGDPTSAAWPSRDLSQLEVSIPELCRRNGASDAFVRMVAFGHDLSSMSALQLLRDTAVGSQTRQWFKIRGGNDRLPAALLRDRTPVDAGVPAASILRARAE